MNILSDDFIREHFDPKIYNLTMLRREFTVLHDFCVLGGLNLEQVYNDYENRENSADWNLEKRIHETESEGLIKKYYATTKMYLYELTLQECMWDYIELFRSIIKFAKTNKIRKALDFGGGIGGLTLCLNKNGISCDYADVPGTTWDFAKYRFEKEGLNTKQLSEEDLGNNESHYNLITSLDCLEHLKSLSRYFKLFHGALGDDGFLLIKSSFYGTGLHLSSNNEFHDINLLNRTLKDIGFRFNGQSIMRWQRNYLIPELFLKLLNMHTSSGRKLLYKKVGNNK